LNAGKEEEEEEAGGGAALAPEVHAEFTSTLFLAISLSFFQLIPINNDGLSRESLRRKFSSFYAEPQAFLKPAPWSPWNGEFWRDGHVGISLLPTSTTLRQRYKWTGKIN
jgi:hypothetical protein